MFSQIQGVLKKQTKMVLTLVEKMLKSSTMSLVYSGLVVGGIILGTLYLLELMGVVDFTKLRQMLGMENFMSVDKSSFKLFDKKLERLETKKDMLRSNDHGESIDMKKMVTTEQLHKDWMDEMSTNGQDTEMLISESH